jgi:hypothetical protein
MGGQKVIEDIAYVRIIREVMGKLPKNLRSRLATSAVIRSTYRYKGPTRNLRLIDNEVVPLTLLQLENQKLSTENSKLKSQNISLFAQNEANNIFRKELQKSVREYKQQNEEKTKVILKLITYVKSFKKSIMKVTNISNDVINIYQNKNDLLLFILAKNMPEETISKTIELMSMLEKPMWADIDRKREAVIKELVLSSETRSYPNGESKLHSPHFQVAKDNTNGQKSYSSARTKTPSIRRIVSTNETP